MSLTYDEAKQSIGKWVRFKEATGRIGSSKQHKMGAKLVAVPTRTTGLLQIPGHKRLEPILLEHMTLWASRNGETHRPRHPIVKADPAKLKARPKGKAISRFDTYDDRPKGTYIPPNREPSVLPPDVGGLTSVSKEPLNLALHLCLNPPATSTVGVASPKASAAPRNPLPKTSSTPSPISVTSVTRTPTPSPTSIPSPKSSTSSKSGTTPEKPPMNQAAEEKQREFLTPAQRRKIEDAILNDWERIDAARPTQAEYCREISSLLKISVTPSRLMNALEAIDKKWPEAQRLGSRRIIPSPAITLLAKSVITLYEKFGEPIPIGLRDLSDPPPSPLE